MASEHRMVPGSHERSGGPECRCGAQWDYWGDRCTTTLPPERTETDE